MNEQLKQQLKHYIDLKESEMQFQVALANGIDPDFSCDIVLEDYLSEEHEEMQKLNTLRNALKIIEGENE